MKASEFHSGKSGRTFKAQSLKFSVWGVSFEGYEFDEGLLKSTAVSHRFCLTCLGALGSTLVTA